MIIRIKLQASVNCRVLFKQKIPRERSRAAESAGNNIAARMPTIAMTASSSMSVKAFRPAAREADVFFVWDKNKYFMAAFQTRVAN